MRYIHSCTGKELDTVISPAESVTNRRGSPGKKLGSLITVEYCNSGEGDEYCFMVLAVQEKSAIYCAYLEFWSSVREYLYYVNREVRLTEKDCLGFEPGSNNRQQCIEYVNSGIPSEPGQACEEMLSTE